MKIFLSNIFPGLLIFLMLQSCSGSKNKDNSVYDSINTDDVQESPFSLIIDIPVNDDGDPSGDMVDDVVRYSIADWNDTIFINPKSGNIYNFLSDKELPFHPEQDIYCSDYIENPQFEIYVTNNGKDAISIDRLQLEVESSIIDPLPYFYIEEQYYYRYAMVVRNESWSNWGSMTIEYSFIKMGEEFNGQYNHKLTVPYFEDDAIIDFKQDLIEDGLNPDKLEAYLEPIDDYHEERIRLPLYGRNATYSDILFRNLNRELSLNKVAELAFPFAYINYYEGYVICALMHARISFSNSSFVKNIVGYIPITCEYSGGADNDLVDNFQIELKPEGNNYKVDFPYITTLRPGQTERIKLSIKCKKSSHHIMKIHLKDQQEIILSSKIIKFYNINGRHSSYHVLNEE